jgi:hypothetical protein
MPRVPKSTKPTEAKSQRERFIEAARELGCDDDEDALKARMKRLAETKPIPLKSLPKRTLRKAVNTPPEVRSVPTPKPKERPASKGRVHKGKTRS